MNYVLTGHDLKHAAEEMLLQLLPSALLHRQDDDGQTDFCRSVLEEDGNTVTITTQTRLYGVMRTSTRTGNIAGQDEMARKRTFSELVKLGIYDTVAPALDTPPAWGALTGVRPAKLVRSLLERGMTRGQVAEQFRTRYFVSPERTALAVRCAAYAQEAVNSLREEEVSLYIGIPFCPSRCAYCSFVSSSIERSADLIAPYLRCTACGNCSHRYPSAGAWKKGDFCLYWRRNADHTVCRPAVTSDGADSKSDGFFSSA